MNVEKILGRPEHQDLINLTSDKRILILGGKGSIGQALAKRCPNAVVTDIDEIDVTNDGGYWMPWGIEVVINLAGAKHAPEGEVDCLLTTNINALGADNVIRECMDTYTKYIQASTCKACNPETVYGATKLIAERMTLNAGGTVARFFNVVETSGNVFEIWANQTEREVYQCERYFISLAEAVGLLIKCIELPSGRYSVNPGEIRYMPKIASDLYGEMKLAPRRRGDRAVEKLCSTSETVIDMGSILKVESWHD